jgi:hypothetical protein
MALEHHDIVRVASVADVHEDTVVRLLSGKKCRGRTRARIVAALQKLGLADHIPTTPPAPRDA